MINNLKIIKEKKMTKKRFWLGILVIVLAFGMMVVSCDDGSRFVGLWVDDSGKDFFLLYKGGSGILNREHPVTKDNLYVSWDFKNNRLVVINEDFGIGMYFILSDSILTNVDNGKILTKK
jgi:hypothetical protein